MLFLCCQEDAEDLRAEGLEHRVTIDKEPAACVTSPNVDLF